MDREKYTYMVRVNCTTYNHAAYIEDSMNGFTMQQTNFPFVCTIIDDASTDGEPEVIRQYLQDHFDLEDTSIVRNEDTDDYFLTFARHKTNHNCYFAVLYLKYNHHSIRKSKESYIHEWSNTKYVALCEGDDYWIDSRKLQMQVDFLVKHPDYTMICHRAKLHSVKKKEFVGEVYCRNSDGNLNPEDVINRTGLYIPTCSLIYTPEIRNNYPDYCQNCNVGDYPLQITAAMKGSIYYFDLAMGVYRIDNPQSWFGQQRFNTIDFSRLQIVKAQVEMFKGFSKDFPQYKRVYEKKIVEHIIKNMPYTNTYREMKQYIDFFSQEIRSFNIKMKMCLLFFSYLPFRIRRRLYIHVFSHYMKLIHYYN